MALRHVKRTHQVNLDWLFDGMAVQNVFMGYVNTKFQIADMMTKAFTNMDLWETLVALSAIVSSSEGGGGGTPAERSFPRYCGADRQGQPQRDLRQDESKDSYDGECYCDGFGGVRYYQNSVHPQMEILQ